MRRLFWLALGVAIGVLAVRRLSRFTRAWTPEGIADQAAGLGGTVRDLAEEVRDAAHVREDELRASLGLDEPGDNRIDPDVEHVDQDKDGS